MTERLTAEEVIVDTKVEYHGTRFTTHRDTLTAVREAYNSAIARCNADGREVVMIEVVLRVKPQ